MNCFGQREIIDAVAGRNACAKSEETRSTFFENCPSKRILGTRIGALSRLGFRPSSYGKLNISILHSKFASKDNSTVKTSEFVKIRVLKIARYICVQFNNAAVTQRLRLQFR